MGVIFPAKRRGPISPTFYEQLFSYESVFWAFLWPPFLFVMSKGNWHKSCLENVGVIDTRGWFHQYIYKQRLLVKIPKALRESQVNNAFLCFWYLRAQKLLVYVVEIDTSRVSSKGLLRRGMHINTHYDHVKTTCVRVRVCACVRERVRECECVRAYVSWLEEKGRNCWSVKRVYSLKTFSWNCDLNSKMVENQDFFHFKIILFIKILFVTLLGFSKHFKSVT